MLYAIRVCIFDGVCVIWMLCVRYKIKRLTMQTLGKKRRWSIFAYAGYHVAHHWTFVSDIREDLSLDKACLVKMKDVVEWKQNAHWNSVA